jgi:PAS domain S-box-containing protein
LATTAAICLNRLAGPVIAPAAFLTFYAAVALSAWYGGLGPALLATGASTLSVGYVLVVASGAAPGIADPTVVLRLALFGVSAGLVGWVAARAQRLRRELEARVQERTSALQRTNSQLQDEIAQRWEAEAEFNSAFDRAPFGMGLVRPDGRPLRINEAMCRMLGYSEAELLTKLVTEVTHPEDRPECLDHIRRLLAGEIQSYEIEKRYLHKLGHVVWAHLGATLVRKKDGTPLCVITQAQDITESRRAQEALDLRAFILNSMAEGVNLVDRDGIIRFMNPALEVMFGYGPGELIGKHVSVLNDYPPDENQRFVAAIIQEVLTTGEFSGEFKSLKKDGTPFVTWARIGIVSIAGEEYVLGLQHDITERKRAEEVLREARDGLEIRVARRTAALTEANVRLQHEIAQREHAEQELHKTEHKYRTLVEQLPAVTYIWAVDDGNRLVYVSPQVESITGFSSAECIADPELWIRQIHPDDRARVLDQAVENVAAGEAFSCEYRVLTRDGQVRWFSDRAVVVRDQADRPLFRRGVQIDITARKEAEEEFKSLNTRTTDILEHMSAAFITVDSETRIAYVNAGMEHLAGRARGTLIGKAVWEVFPKARETVFWKQYERVRAEHAPLDAESYYAPLGRWLKVHMYPTGNDVSTLVEDITEQHQREAAVVSDVLHALNAHLDVAKAFPVIAAGLNAITRCDDSVLVLFDDKAEWATVAALSEGLGGLALGNRFRVAELPGARDVLTGLAHLAQDLAVEVDSPMAQVGYELGFRSAIWLPLRGDGETVGAVGLVWRRYSGGSTADLPLLGQIAGAVALAAEKGRLFEEVRAGHERLKVLSQRLIEVQEAERRHIARELHDEIGQQLTGLKLLLDTIRGRPVQVALDRLAEAHELIDDLVCRVRRMSLDLRPAMLDDLGLLPALLWLFDRYTGQTGVRVNFEHAGLEQRVSEELETAAYRMVQEALTNVARHAGVSEVTVRVGRDAGMLRLQVVDHGAGFDCNGALRGRHTGGLAGMRERAVLLGGRMTVESAPGAGTHLTAEFPLPEGGVAADGAQRRIPVRGDEAPLHA